ncbi:AraC family transcriptional regulator [Chitinophaga sp.]|uniref:helix-turn-helix transcriptional regulator n=1 Tax=Chitinophaga sp. TaxID=1869181 RepID=UPI0031E39BB4
MFIDSAGKTEKLFYVEREEAAYDEVTALPEEYLQLILPYAGVFFETDESCDIISQHKQLGPFSFWIQEVYAHTDIVLCPYTPYHIWALHFMYDASLEVELYKDSSFTLQERECNLFSLESDLHKVPMVAGQKLLSCHINIIPEEFRELALLHPKLSRLAALQSQGVTGPLNQSPYHINPVCNFLLESMLSCRHINIPAEVFLLRCCLNLFYNFAQQDLQLPLVVTDILHRDQFSELFKFMIQKPYKNFTIPELAWMFDLSVKDLTEGFLKLYSVPIHHFIRMIKMMMVFELLTEKATPLSTIANAAGYGSWQNMDRVFKSYYGCELEELRRAM